MLNAFLQKASRAVNSLDVRAERQSRSPKTSDVSKDRYHWLHAADLDCVVPIVLVIAKQADDVEQAGSTVFRVIQRRNPLFIEQESLFVRPGDCAHSLLGSCHASVESTQRSGLNRPTKESSESLVWIEKQGRFCLHQSTSTTQLSRFPRFLRPSFLSILCSFLARDENCRDTNYPSSGGPKPIGAAAQILLYLEAPRRVQYERPECKNEDCATHREDARPREFPAVSLHAPPCGSLVIGGILA